MALENGVLAAVSIEHFSSISFCLDLHKWDVKRIYQLKTTIEDEIQRPRFCDTDRLQSDKVVMGIPPCRYHKSHPYIIACLPEVDLPPVLVPHHGKCTSGRHGRDWRFSIGAGSPVMTGRFHVWIAKVDLSPGALCFPKRGPSSEFILVIEAMEPAVFSWLQSASPAARQNPMYFTRVS